MAKISTKLDSDDPFARAMFKAMDEYMTEESRKIVDRHLAQIKEEIERKRSQMVASAVLHISRHTQLEYLRDVIKFEVVRTDKEL